MFVFLRYIFVLRWLKGAREINVNTYKRSGTGNSRGTQRQHINKYSQFGGISGAWASHIFEQ